MNKIPSMIFAGFMIAMIIEPASAAWQNTVRSYDAPLVAHYDAKSGMVVVNIFGTRDDMNFMRQLMEIYRNLIETDFIPYLSVTREIVINSNEFRITYRNRNEEGTKDLLIWEQGKFKFPLEK